MKMRYGGAMIDIVSRSPGETQKVARILAHEIRADGARRPRGAVVVALSGELGAGKTTFTQGFARALGIKEKIQSPTFVLMKIYKLPGTRSKLTFRHLIHIDCYRIHNPKDLLHLGLKDMLRDRDAIILIEWPERIKKIIPPDALRLSLGHGAGVHERNIHIKKHA